ncbi:outer membrane protein assembly factor BamB [Ruminobacter sp. RM87]|uniref:outer membrane protein assembly factor BamB n=1 Tax=Ruminobacter sp. RM87 TaxID=1200567 RepID=UPI000689B772|nr:outer membrane protein assembly factor BamB [Ruminobacter sp. RM87]
MFSFCKKQLISGMALAVSVLLNGCSNDVDVYQPVSSPQVINSVATKVVWSRSVGSGVGNYFTRLSPVVDEVKVYAASRNGDVYAMNKDDGSREWHLDLDDEDENDDRRSTRLSGGLVLQYGVLYVASENGYLYAIDAEEGTLKWKANVGQEVLATPAVGYDKVFVLTISGQMFAFNSDNGEKVWANGNDGNMISLRGDSNPVAIADKVVIYGTANGKINIVSQETGVLIHQLNVNVSSGATRIARLNDVNSTPLSIMNEVYSVAFNGNLQGFLIPEFSSMWKRQYSSCLDLASDSTDIALTDVSSHIYAIIRVDGTQRWANTQLTYRNVTAPTYFKRHVVVGDYEGFIYFLDDATGEIKSMRELDSSGMYTAAVTDDNYLYFQSRDGTLYAVDIDDENKED